MVGEEFSVTLRRNLERAITRTESGAFEAFLFFCTANGGKKKDCARKKNNKTKWAAIGSAKGGNLLRGNQTPGQGGDFTFRERGGGEGGGFPAIRSRTTRSSKVKGGGGSGGGLCWKEKRFPFP